MATFAILSKQPDPRVHTRLERAYPGKTYQWSDTAVLVVTDDLAPKISDNLGVPIGANRKKRLEAAGDALPPQHPQPITGIVVLKLGATYWGHTESAFWEWLKASFEDAN